MQISYQKKGNHIYAKVPGESYREDGHVKKRNTIYLGRVIDKENNIFYNKERGVFRYDISTNTYSDVDSSYQGELKDDHRKKSNPILDFGDSYFIDSLIRAMHYDEVLYDTNYKNQDTLWAMVVYYVLTGKANSHAKTWFQGNFANILYPKADIHSQGINNLLDSLGSEETRCAYFKAHIQWLNKYVSNEPAVIIDSIGLPNSIKMNMTQFCNYNGKISNEAKRITAIQRGNGYPIMFWEAPDNTIDVSALSTTITTLARFDVEPDLAILDAEYISSDNLNYLFKAKIEFVACLPKKSKGLYKDVLDKGLASLIQSETVIEFSGRYNIFKQIEFEVGKYKAYAYLCFDIDSSSDGAHKTIKWSEKKGDNKMSELFELPEVFVIISSLPYLPKEILDIFYTRQHAEQYHDINKGTSRPTLSKVYEKRHMLGLNLLRQIAFTINLYIQKEIHFDPEDKEEMFMGLRNQKCIVYSSKIVTNRGQSDTTEYYRKFKLKFPKSFDISSDSLIPYYDNEVNTKC